MSSRSVFRWFESNLISIALAALLALTVWIVATQEANPIEEVDYERPITIETVGLASGLTITNSESLPPARVRLRAARNTWRALAPEDVSVVADLTDLGPGVHDVPLRPSVNAQALLVEVRPSRIQVEIEEVRQREMPVQIIMDGQVPAGYRAGTAALNPSSVVVSGPRSRVELVSEVRAEIALGGLRETFEELLPLVALDSNGLEVDKVSLTPTAAVLRIPIFQEADFREVAVRVNANIQPAPGYYVSRITADPPLVPVRGNPEALRLLNVIETQPINLQGLKEETTIVAQLQAPPGVTLDDVQSVEVLILIAAQPDFRVIEVPVRTVGLATGLSANVLPANAVVSLSGPQPVLEDLSNGDNVIVSVDLAGLRVGNHQVEPEVEIVSSVIPAEDLQRVIIESLLPTVIEVEITAGGGTDTR